MGTLNIQNPPYSPKCKDVLKILLQTILGSLSPGKPHFNQVLKVLNESGLYVYVQAWLLFKPGKPDLNQALEILNEQG